MTTEFLNDEQISEIDFAIGQIYAEDYFTHLWEKVWRTKPAPLTALTPAQGYKMFQDFWEALPDNKSIRRNPFYLICDLAEKYCLELAGDFDEEGPMPDEASF